MEQTWIIGIAGPSGSGKSRFAKELAAELSGRIFSADSYFKSELPTMISPEDGKPYPDWNSPDSIDYGRLKADVLKEKEAGPHPYLVVEGSLIYAIPDLKELFDYRIFVTARPETCLYRRIVRNMELFGQTAEAIGDYYLKCARHREAEFCWPTIQEADFVVDNDVSYETDKAACLTSIREHLG